MGGGSWTRRRLPGIPLGYRLLRNKWWFDELYQFLFIRPVLRIAGLVAALDKQGSIGSSTAPPGRPRAFGNRRLDRPDLCRRTGESDGRVVLWLGLWLRSFQTGNLRQYVMLIAVGTVALYVLISLYAFAV